MDRSKINKRRVAVYVLASENKDTAMAVFVNTFFDKRVEQLFDLAARVESVFRSAGVEYRIIGGLATYLYVEEQEPDAGRLTKDINITVNRADMGKIAAAAKLHGLEYRQWPA